MTTTSYCIVVMSGIASASVMLSAALVIADTVSRSIAARWWRKRDPLWIDPISTGASASHHGCSDPYISAAASLQQVAAPNGTSHPAKTQPKAHSLTGADRTPVEFISSLIASGALRRVS